MCGIAGVWKHNGSLLRAANLQPLFDRIKHRGPDGTWFRGESIDYINKTLRSKKARIYGLVDPRYVNRILDEYCSGKANHRLLIWSLLSLEHFLQKFLH